MYLYSRTPYQGYSLIYIAKYLRKHHIDINRLHAEGGQCDSFVHIEAERYGRMMVIPAGSELFGTDRLQKRNGP